jgi:hypothetical protein
MKYSGLESPIAELDALTREMRAALVAVTAQDQLIARR